MDPVMLCMKKDRATYQCLFQKITAQCPEIKHHQKAYGTDAEVPLQQTLEVEFPFALGFICRTHIVRNLDHKLKNELNLSEKFFRKVVADVFGGKHKKDWSIVPLAKNIIFLQSYLLNGTKVRLSNGNGREINKNPWHQSISWKTRQKLSIITVDLQPSARWALMMNCLTTMILRALMHWSRNGRTEKSDIPKFLSDMKELHDKQRHKYAEFA